MPAWTSRRLINVGPGSSSVPESAVQPASKRVIPGFGRKGPIPESFFVSKLLITWRLHGLHPLRFERASSARRSPVQPAQRHRRGVRILQGRRRDHAGRRLEAAVTPWPMRVSAPPVDVANPAPKMPAVLSIETGTVHYGEGAGVVVLERRNMPSGGRRRYTPNWSATAIRGCLSLHRA